MEKKAAKTSGSRPNPRNGSVHRHGHMNSSAAASGVHGTPRNFNIKQQDGLHQEKSFQRSRTFCGRPSQIENNTMMAMRRSKTHPELLNRDDHNMRLKMNHPVDQALSSNKLLAHVTVAQSSGSLRLLLSKDATVEDVIKATLLLYAKDGRRPLLLNVPTLFGLHYSQFSFDCLNPADKIEDLGSRTFFLCSKATAKESCRLSSHSGETAVTARLSSPGREIQNISRIAEPWYNRLMECFLLPP